MKKNLFVAFTDSVKDPTFAPIEEACIVYARRESDDENPCAFHTNNPRTPMIPRNFAEVIRFAEFMGWQGRIENGRVVLETDITAP